MDAVVESAHLVPASDGGVKHALFIPARGDACSEEGFDFGREIKRIVMPGIKERLDAEAVARSEETTVAFIPEDEGELAAKLVQTMGAEFLVEMESDLAVGAGAEAVPADSSSR